MVVLPPAENQTLTKDKIKSREKGEYFFSIMKSLQYEEQTQNAVGMWKQRKRGTKTDELTKSKGQTGLNTQGQRSNAMNETEKGQRPEVKNHDFSS